MRRSQAKRNRDTWNYVLGGGVAVLVLCVAIGAWYLHQAGIADEVDAITLCPTAGHKGHVVLLVDKTDILGFVQNRSFLQLVTHFADGSLVKEGELLSIFVLGGDFKASPEPIFEKCNPGTGAGRSEITASTSKMKNRFEKEFQKPIENLVSIELVSKESSSKSPIFEMLQIVSLRFTKNLASTKYEKRLHIVSDMLHNTNELSFFGRTVPDYPQISKSSGFSRLRTTFKDVSVNIHYLMYRPDLQTKRLQLFWEDYFSDMGGRLTKTDFIAG